MVGKDKLPALTGRSIRAVRRLNRACPTHAVQGLASMHFKSSGACSTMPSFEKSTRKRQMGRCVGKVS